MSLINEMLKDLEDRGAREPAATDVQVSTHGRPRGNRWLPASLGLLVIALTAVVVILLLSGRGDDQRTERVVPADAGPVAEPAPVTEPEPVVEPIEPDEIAGSVRLSENATAARQPASAPVVTGEAEKNANTGADEPSPVVEPTPGTDKPESGERDAADRKVRSAAEAPEHDGDETLIVRRHQPTPAEMADRAAREGFAALRRGDWRAASRLLGELVLLEPANDDAREGLVAALNRQGRLAEADGVLLDGLAKGTRPARFAKVRARMQFARGELDAALDSLAVAVPEVAADPEYHALKAAIAQQAGRATLAAEIYGRLTRFEPANGTWQAGLGMALDALGDRNGAREAYARAFETRELEPALLEHVKRRLNALSRT